MKVPCSNCMTPLVLSLRTMTIETRVPASGRGSKRVEARVLTSDVAEVDAGFYQWEAPCCPGYEDSLDVYAS